jgi:hypothetical protein
MFPALTSASRDTQIAVTASFIVIPVAAVAISGAITVIVAYHRIVVLDQMVATPFPVNARDVLGFAWKLAVLFTPFILAATIIVAIAYLVLPEDQAEREGLEPYVVVPIYMASICGVLVFGRLSIALPAIATGDNTMTLARSWNLTRGNTWRIFWGIAFCAIPFNFVSKILNRFLDKQLETEGTAFVGPLVAIIVVDTMGYAVTAAFLSHAYLQLREANNPKN